MIWEGSNNDFFKAKKKNNTSERMRNRTAPGMRCHHCDEQSPVIFSLFVPFCL